MRITTPYSVVLDACGIYAASLRDLLLELALSDLFRLHWTNRIHDEWTHALRANRPDLAVADIARVRALMDMHFPSALIDGYEHLEPSLVLPDADDRHVGAAALHARCNAIITYNLEDFPIAVLDPLGIEVIHPDSFVIAQLDLDEPSVVAAARRVRARPKSPPFSAEEYLERLLVVGLVQTVARLEAHVR
ncbi:PIN domain-containing protein [Vineibacter terrae]|uniref:PIN domain-containing protein n=1 Tax=Vineibacter terrae TaxID=2586908 RepID=UPI002E369C65|nr:PIN domain-containing protein [Vineibacter terrae]HEX2889745.1 PIN domain-containing protein [Vineibacter terrae]